MPTGIFPMASSRYLRDIGLLSPRLTLAHGIHARPDELEMIAASGARIVTNFSSNLHLHSGLAPIAAAHKCGCAIAVGVDGLALDEDDDVIREMRLVQLAHGGLGFARTWTRPEFLGARHPQRPRRHRRPRPRRTFAPARRPISSCSTSTASTATPSWPSTRCSCCSRAATPALVRDVVVDGRTIVREGKVVGVDLPAIEQELRGMYRAGVRQFGGLQQAWGPLARELRGWFEGQVGCG